MKRFYIIYNDDTSVIQGTVDCDEKTFEKRFVLPLGKDVYSYQLRDIQEPPKEELTLETLNQITLWKQFMYFYYSY